MTISLPAASGKARIAAASCGEAITPSAPAAKARRGALGDDFADRAGADQTFVEIGAVERSQDGDSEDFQAAVAGAVTGGANDMGVAVDGEEIEIIAGDAAHGSLDRGTDVEELHVEKDALAVNLLELVGEGQSAAVNMPRPIL